MCDCGCATPDPNDMLPVLDLSHLWQDGKFYWDRGDGQNALLQDLSLEVLMGGSDFISRILRGYKDIWDEALDVLDVFPDVHRATLLNRMEQMCNILIEFLSEERRRKGMLADAW